MINSARHVIRVLVVADDETDELTMHRLNQVWPFDQEMSVVSASSGEEALEKMRTTCVSLVLLDWSMPGMNGGEFLERMRRQGTDLPVVVLTGSQREELPTDLDALAAAFLCKDSVDAGQFRTAIERSLHLRERLASTGKASHPRLAHRFPVSPMPS